MPKERLRTRIQELLDELEGIEAENPAAREQLSAVVDEIREAVESSEDDALSATEALIERLNEATRDFEESHPTLTALVGRVADSLANLGI